MNIRLKEVYIFEDNITGQEPVFKHLIDNSYAEWNLKWKLQDMEIEEISWKAVFEVEYEEKKGDFIIDSDGEYLTHLDLEGYIGGERVELDDEIELKVASKSSGILTALYYSEVSRFGILRERVEKTLYYTIFPEWTRGLVAEGVNKLEGVKEFVEAFEPIFEDLEILKKYDIDMSNYQVTGGTEALQEAFRTFANEYFNEEVFFFLHDINYVGSTKALVEASNRLDIDTSIVDEYE